MKSPLDSSRSQPYRLATGGRIDRAKPLTFTFNGKRLQGYQGDTVASALLANGVRLVGRSFKYHRPRGIVGSGPEEPNAILQVGRGALTTPNLQATEVELAEGLQAGSVNCWPSVEHDIGAINGLFSRFLPPGFYYKTFMWPSRMWKTYERFIRKAAGLGVSPKEPDPDRYDRMNTHCDVLVVGGGAAGLAAALEAGRAGARVILADERRELGGSLLDGRDEIDGAPALEWVNAASRELASMKEVRLLLRSTVFGYYDHNFLTVLQRLSTDSTSISRPLIKERVWRVRAKQVVLATGAIERPLVFPNNDRPGVMLASAVSAYVNRYAVAPGSRPLVFTNNDSAYRTVLDLAEAGIPVQAVVDVRPEPNGPLPSRVKDMGIPVIGGHVIVDVKGTKRVKGVEIMSVDASGERVEGRRRSIRCDLVAVSGGWNPTVHLHCQSGGGTRYDGEKGCFVPDAPAQEERSAGSSKGSFALGDCLGEGLEVGAEAARAAGFGDGRVSTPVPTVEDRAEEPLKAMWVAPSRRPPVREHKQFVDMQEDVTAGDIVLAAREGYDSMQLLNRYTTLGFGTDQGKLGNVNGMGVLANHLGADIESVGTITFRPPYTSVTFGAIAGREIGGLLDPVRKTAIHRWHIEHRAVMEDVGQWKRPWYYPQPGESMEDAVNRECMAARNAVALLDQSTLGKIDVQGPDAAEFLNRVYTNNWLKLGIGRARYGLMLSEDGMVMDDGVSARFSDGHFTMFTTTGGAAGVMAWMETWLQTEWTELKVYLTSVTDHWSTMSIVGPRAREVITRICQDIDFSPEAFPFLSFREGTVAGVPARVFRISFSGEMTYEVNISANYGLHVWESIMEAGEPLGITPYGTEAMHVLRTEKAFIIVGQDTDGSVTPVDLGMDWVMSKRKDFLGKRSLSRASMVKDDRKQLVGLLTDRPSEVLPDGGQIVENPKGPKPLKMIGHVTSTYYSACLGHSIALAMVKGGRARMGERVYVPLAKGRVAAAVITDPVFYDPEGERQNV